MSMAVGGSGARADINVTPLIDVLLVLLIIFMVITPMLQRGKDVNLPSAKATDKESKESDPLVLSVTEKKEIYVESNAFNDEGLENEIRTKLTLLPGRRILLKGDDRLTFGDVRRVMEIARKAGATSINMGVQELKGK
jgi:biopolymer transport protein TolR